MGDDGWIKWALGGIMTVGGTACGWILMRINRVEDCCINSKVSKDAFSEFKDANNRQHDRTYAAINDLKNSIKGE
jgi:hypothetical protein